MKERPLVVIPDDLPVAFGVTDLHQPLEEAGFRVAVYDSLPRDEEELAQRLQGAHSTINVRSSSPFTGAVLERCPQLRHVAVFGIGYDNVDVRAARSRRITVTNTPGYATVAVAEATLALMLGVLRRVPQHHRVVQEGRWTEAQAVGQLYGKTLGVIGVGAIGQRVVELGRALGMRVLAWTFHPTPERAQALGVTFCSLEELLGNADIVTLHVPLTAESGGLLGRRELALMKPTAVLVNTARGSLVEEEALVEALRQGRIAGTGLDVFDREPLPPDHPLTGLDNVVLSPHLGSVTPEAQYEGLKMAVDNVVNLWLGNGTNVVN